MLQECLAGVCGFDRLHELADDCANAVRSVQVCGLAGFTDVLDKSADTYEHDLPPELTRN